MIDKILLTHGHFDHIGGIEVLREHIPSPVLIHEEGESYLADPEKNLSRYCGPDIIVRGARYFRDGDELELSAGHRLKVLHTPGHSEDSVVFYDAAGAWLSWGTLFFAAVLAKAVTEMRSY